MSQIKRFFSFCLALAMVLGIFSLESAQVFAASTYTAIVQVEAQNEDGSINELRDQYMTKEATIEVSLNSLVVYVSANERELFFDDNEDGVFDNDIVTYVDGIRTYRLNLTSFEQMVKTTFNVSGTNPNYDPNTMPLFYLAFSADSATKSMIDGVYSGTKNVLPFTDVKADQWYYNSIDYVYTNEIMDGTSSTEFAPNATVTRAMVATVLWRIDGEPQASGESPFRDVTQGWYKDAVTWAAGKEIVDGYGEGLFGPEDNVTREQMATMLYRYSVYKGDDVSASNSLDGYSDANQISSYALVSMKWANAKELITGRTDTALEPTGTATRAELAAVLNRYLANETIFAYVGQGYVNH